MLWRQTFLTRIRDFVVHRFLNYYSGYGRVDDIRDIIKKQNELDSRDTVPYRVGFKVTKLLFFFDLSGLILRKPILGWLTVTLEFSKSVIASL